MEIEVLQIIQSRLPDWDEDLAKRIRPDLTLSMLEAEIAQVVESDQNARLEDLRNNAISEALYQIASIDKVSLAVKWV